MKNKSDDDQLLFRIKIEETLSEYDDLIAPDWCKKFAAVLKHAPDIREAGDDLIVQWRVATRVADFPAVMTKMFSHFAASTLRSGPTSTNISILTTAWEKLFVSRMPSIAKGLPFRQAMRDIQQEARAKAKVASKKAITDLSADAIWSTYVRADEFRFRVWSTMQVCQVAAYNAYDGFLQKCTQGKRVSLDKRLKSAYDTELYNSIFQTRDIQIARKLRNAISHNRGRLTKELDALKPELVCLDDMISVYPKDIRRQIAAMGQAAMTLARHHATRQPKAD